jgi:hypothetical protein
MRHRIFACRQLSLLRLLLWQYFLNFLNGIEAVATPQPAYASSVLGKIRA